jgi:hypothetical protein
MRKVQVFAGIFNVFAHCDDGYDPGLAGPFQHLLPVRIEHGIAYVGMDVHDHGTIPILSLDLLKNGRRPVRRPAAAMRFD